MHSATPNRTCCLSIALCLALVCSVGIAADDAKKDEKAKATKDVKIKGITLKVPEDWEQQEITTTTSFRLAQFKIEKVEGDTEAAELAVFFLDSSLDSSGGGVDPNLKRWIGQFEEKERKAKTMQGESTQGKYAIADITGTYNMPIGPPVLQKTKPLPGARMLGVVLSVQGTGNYFLKLTGPEKTVTAAAKAFRDSFGADVSKEKELKLEE